MNCQRLRDDVDTIIFGFDGFLKAAHLTLDAAQSRRRVEDRLRVDADHVVDDELETGQADAAVRDLGELEGQRSAFDAARRTEALIATSLLPQADLSFKSALAAYENGKVDFATLMDAQRQIRIARQSRIKAQFEAQMSLAEIERIVGEDL